MSDLSKLEWEAFPGEHLHCLGLLARDDRTDLSRQWDVDGFPEGVQKQARFPSGVRLVLRSDSSTIALKVDCDDIGPGLDVYVDGSFYHTTLVPEGESEVVCLSDDCRRTRTVTIYLPLRRTIRILGCAVDPGSSFEPIPEFSQNLPLLLYGSSVCQGIGAARAGMSYAAVLGRRLDLDFVNLGFGGSGKAEPEVVERVVSEDASCFLLDLGKSYGLQSASAYTTMLESIRHAHPGVPIICVTPIFSSRELHQREYRDLSDHTRVVVREAVSAREDAGDTAISLVEGETLLGPNDADGLSGDGLHPNDLGHSIIAERLIPTLKTAIC